MRHATAARAAIMVALGLAACEAPTRDIADFSVVTRLPKEVGPGGFLKHLEADGVATGFFYEATISDCGPDVVAAASAWAAQRSFLSSDEEIGEREASLRLSADATPEDAFVIRYTLSSNDSDARVRITYEGTAAASPAPPETLLSSGMQELIDALLIAARCERGG